ncbi:hypothetical protein HAX54_029254 [Datura stramonium]|uniref:Uncharacterized protein n=1 Tax=Datura stramonium TaxID=4076 RepID=A0ABS8V863_DATST|nr:hypothetical protein [Datura stramonium]
MFTLFLADRTEDDSVSCQDQGVKFVKAKVNSKLSEFLEKAHKDVNLALLCWPQDTWNVDDTNLFTMPIVIVQITEFECGGLALSMSHAHTEENRFPEFPLVFDVPSRIYRNSSCHVSPQRKIVRRLGTVAKRLYITSMIPFRGSERKSETFALSSELSKIHSLCGGSLDPCFREEARFYRGEQHGAARFGEINSRYGEGNYNCVRHFSPEDVNVAMGFVQNGLEGN